MFEIPFFMLGNIPYGMIGASLVLTEQPTLFFFFLCANYLFNSFLKNWIQQPRPKNSDVHNKHSYGMPSQHAQTASFTTAFIWDNLSSLQQTIFTSLIVITMAQRVWANCHTVSQVVLGAVLGVVVGVLCYRVAKRVGQTKVVLNPSQPVSPLS